MKNLLLLLVVGWMSVASAANSTAKRAPQLPLDMSGEEYSNLIEKSGVMNKFTEDTQSDQLKKVLVIGKRNLDWVAKINSVRPEAQWILLSTKETQTGIPIDKPKQYNGTTVLKDYDDVVKALDPKISTVLMGSQALTSTVDVSDAVFTEAARKVDKSYQMASRWLLLSPYLNQLAQRKAEDIRGYYFLSRLPDVQGTLKNYANLSATEKEQVGVWLKQMCYVQKGSDTTCKKAFDDAVTAGKLGDFYATYLTPNANQYNEFFAIGNARSDIKSSNTGGQIRFAMPFLDPKNEPVLRFVKDNVEDEWRGSNWKLELNIVASGSSAAHVVFEAGATPHVNGLGGSTITMDKNSSLKDYNNTWTIRHEYGHVLGFPDCYLEYYDPSSQLMISYQIDLANIMCSRKGAILPMHYDELLKAYGRTN